MNMADFHVLNKWQADVDVTRMVNEEQSDYNNTLPLQHGDTINIPNLIASLVISAPAGLDLKRCPITFQSKVDLEIVYSRTHSRVTFKIKPNDLPPDVPTDVNVTLGPEEPEDPGQST